jgi:phosphatidylglycerophosphatase C
VAAFDFDGTLVPGDSLWPYLRRLAGRRVALGTARALPGMVVAYRRGGRDAAKAVLLRRVLGGVDAARGQRVGAAYGRDLAARVTPAMAERLHWHQRQGHRLVLVSASLTVYLEPFAAAAGFDDVIATRLEVGAAGTLTGRLVGANVRGEEKATRLRALLGAGPVELWAYGDSAGDRELLAMADHPTWVGGRPR